MSHPATRSRVTGVRCEAAVRVETLPFWKNTETGEGPAECPRGRPGF